MALIIKGKMPVGKGCDECEFQTSRCEQLDACTCFLFNGCIHNFHNERHKDCPIIGEIPDKHGRLIDADAEIAKLEAFMKVLNKETESGGRQYHECDCVLHYLTDAPTIVEASK